MTTSDTESEIPMIQTEIETTEDYTTNETILEARDLNVYYGADQALSDINVEIPQKQVTAIIGPSGCGRSTFLQCLNRMNDLIDIAHVEGEVRFKG